MKFEIVKIILWPKDSEKQIRTLEFKTDEVNVITGDSQTGKSSIVAIIDYCLASTKCSIPVGIIREKTDWFGLIIKVTGKYLMLARREPGAIIASSEFFIEELADFTTISQPHKNSTAESVKQRLNELCGLSNITGGVGYESNYYKRPSFRDLAAFQFQAQHIVANPNTLFYKADTTEHRERLKMIFPLVLGAVTAEDLRKKAYLKELEADLEKKKNVLALKKASIDQWVGQIKGQFYIANEIGLVPKEIVEGDNWTTFDYVNALTRITGAIDSKVIQIPIGSTEDSIKRIIKLKNEERDLSRILESKRSFLYQFQKFDQAVSENLELGEIGLKRSSSSGWLTTLLSEESKCVLCGSDSDAASKNIAKLIEYSKNLKERTKQIGHSVSDTFGNEITTVKKDITSNEEKLNQVRQQLNVLMKNEKDEQSARQKESNIYKFIGGLEYSLKEYSLYLTSSSLNDEIKNLEKNITILRNDLNPRAETIKINNAMDAVSKNMLGYQSMLGVEKPDSTAFVDIKELTVRVESKDGKKDYLWEIGSGANWMGYHISAILGLHEHFATLSKNYVPNFLVIDQPSQVYFPDKWPKDESRIASDKKLANDLLRVHSIFKSLSNSVKKNKNGLQIIVLEHAPELTWNGIDKIHVVEKFRDGNKLIPNDWMS